MIAFMYLCLSLLLLLVAMVCDLTTMATQQYRTNMIITLIASVGSAIFAVPVMRTRHGLFKRAVAALIVVIAVLLVFDTIGRF